MIVIIAADNADARRFADAIGARSWASCTPRGSAERGVEADRLHATPSALELPEFDDLRARALICTASRPRRHV